MFLLCVVYRAIIRYRYLRLGARGEGGVGDSTGGDEAREAGCAEGSEEVAAATPGLASLPMGAARVRLDTEGPPCEPYMRSAATPAPQRVTLDVRTCVGGQGW